MHHEVILAVWAAVITCMLTQPAHSHARDVPATRWPEWLTVEQLEKEVPHWLTLSSREVGEVAAGMLPEKRERLGKHAGDLFELWVRTGNDQMRQRSLAMVRQLLADWDSAFIAQITSEDGSRNPVNVRARDAALELALHHAMTGDETSAAEARRILLQLARVMPNWPLWDRQGHPHAQDEADYFTPRWWDASGLWGEWYHQDLEKSFPLLRAYDLLRTTISEGDRQIITNRIFRHQMDLVRKWDVGYTNMVGSRINGIIHFGHVLDDPVYIHEAVRLIRQTYDIGYYADGSWKEISPAYNKMVTFRLVETFPALLAGYSDPVGYVDPVDGTRFDHLDLAAEYAIQNDRMMRALRKMTLPNRQALAINDSDPMPAWWDAQPTASTPQLLGVAGHGVLGFGEGDRQQQLRLNWDGTNNHEHHDRLHLTWFAHGRELFSETAYRGAPASPRQWHVSTAGHNTVVIDNVDQHSRFRGNVIKQFHEDDAQHGMIRWRYRDLGQGNTRNHGNLLMFNAAAGDVQVMEAEGENAYTPRADLYRRTLALVDLGQGDGYVLDIFRVKGGEQHDYMLHGCLDDAYEAAFDIPMRPASGVHHQYIEARQSSKPAGPFHFAFTYPDGLSTRSHVAAPADVEVVVGHAPAMRREETSPFVMLRHQGPESLYVVVHEACRDDARVTGVQVRQSQDDPMAVAVDIQLDNGRQDTFLSTLGDGRIALADGTRFHGRLAYLRRKDTGLRLAYVFDGSRLEAHGRVLIDSTDPLHGQVVATRHRERGDAEDAIIVTGKLPVDGSLVGQTIIVDMADVVSWASCVLEVRHEDGGSVVVVEHEPGFDRHGELIKMNYFPGWGLRGKCHYTIARSGRWGAEAPDMEEEDMPKE